MPMPDEPEAALKLDESEIPPTLEELKVMVPVLVNFHLREWRSGEISKEDLNRKIEWIIEKSEEALAYHRSR